jgi:hypothetical protein
VNLFEYALMDPVNLFDPEGTTPQASGGGGSGGRRITGRPEATENPQEKYRQDKDGRWYYKDKRTGMKVLKPPGWVPPWMLRTPLILLPLPTDPNSCLKNPADPSCLQACPGGASSADSG